MSGAENDVAADDLSKLARGLQQFSGPGYAAVDGAQWTNLPGTLADVGLSGRSLFLGAGSQVELAGPWLVCLEPPAEKAEAVLSLVGEKPAAVFWRCGAGEAALWRHMRTLNQIEMPRTEQTAGDGDAEQNAPSGMEIVFFRHWDPRSLGAILPLLDEAQFARVLGPADEVLFCDPRSLGGLGTRRAVRTPQLTALPHGRLRLTAAQVEALGATMQERSRRRICHYLRQAAPEQVGTLAEAELDATVASSVKEAHDMGVSGEVSVGLWAYMRATSANDLSRETMVHRFMADPRQGVSPDARMQSLFDLRSRALQDHG